MNNFFRATAEVYEQIRNTMDERSGFPSDTTTTWFNPASEAPKDIYGNCIIGCTGAIAAEFRKMKCQEITSELYFQIGANDKNLILEDLPTLEEVAVTPTLEEVAVTPTFEGNNTASSISYENVL